MTVDGGSESVVLVQEIRWSDPDEGALRDLARGVMAGLSASTGVPVGNVVFVRPGAVLRSTSGKVRRVAMRRLFEDAALTPVTEELDAGVRRTFRAHREDAARSGGPAAFSPPLAQSTVQTNA